MNKTDDKNEKLNIQIRSFLKKVGFGSHQLIEENLKSSNLNCNVCLKLEINNKEIKKFETNIK
mgnify:CR=1 FL=1